MNGVSRLAIFASVLVLLIVLQGAIVQNAEKISERFSPAYIPMTRQEIVNIYPDYFQDRTFGPDEKYDEMMHQSEVRIADLKRLHHRAVFYEKYVNENTKLIENAANYIFVFLYFLIVLLSVRYLYSLRHRILGFYQKTGARLGFGVVISKVKVKVAEDEYSKIKRLRENGLISEQEFEKRKIAIAKKINENLTN